VLRRKIINILKYCALLCVAALAAIAAWTAWPLLNDHDLEIKWEGIVAKRNFRDSFASINECLGKQLLPEGQIFRSNEMFSGWSCEGIGNPDVIYSLNFEPDDEEEENFCRRSFDEVLIGRHFNDIELSDLELLDTWDKEPVMIAALCKTLSDVEKEAKQSKKILLHCEAGRDRTGLVSALFASLYAEGLGQFNDEFIKAAECDYRKSRSIKPYKYGRIETFLNFAKQHGGPRALLEKHCQRP
jgi:hypothetical protein